MSSYNRETGNQKWSTRLLAIMLFLLVALMTLARTGRPPAMIILLVIVIFLLFLLAILRSWSQLPSPRHRWFMVFLAISLFLPIVAHLIVELHLYRIQATWPQYAQSLGRRNADHLRQEFERLLISSETLANRISGSPALQKAVQDPNVENRAEIFQTLSRLYDPDRDRGGVEILDENGQTVAWAGTVFPQRTMAGRNASSEQPKVTVISDPIYTLLWVRQTLYDTTASRQQGSVNVFRPLAANIPGQSASPNQGIFLHDASARIHAPIQFDFLQSSQHLSSPEGGAPSASNEISVTLPDADNRTLGVARFSLPSYSDYSAARRGMVARIATAVIGGVLIVLALLFLRKRYASVSVQPASGTHWLQSPAAVCIVMTLLLWILRFLLILLGFPEMFCSCSIFDPSYYSADFFFGLARSTGNLWITLLFLLCNIYLVWKVSSITCRSHVPTRRAAFFQIAGVFSATVLIHFLFDAYVAGMKSLVRDSPFSFFEYFHLFSSAPFAVTVMNVFLLSLSLFALAFLLLFLLSGQLRSLWPSTTVRMIWIFLFYLLTGFLWFAATGHRTYPADTTLLVVILFIACVWATPRLEHIRTHGLTYALLATIACSIVSFPVFHAETFREEDRHIRDRVAELLESSDTRIESMIREALEYFRSSPHLREALDGKNPSGLDHLAFVEWMGSPLAHSAIQSRIVIINEIGATVSQFSSGNPVALLHSASAQEQPVEYPDGVLLTSTQTRLHGVEFDLCSGAVPISSEGRLIGAVMLNGSRRTSPLARLEDPRPTILQPFTSAERLVHKYGPNQLTVSLFERETLVESTDPALLKGYRPSGDILKAVFEQKMESVRVQERIAGKDIVQFYFPQRREDRITGMVSVGYEHVKTWTIVHDFLRFTFTHLLIVLCFAVVFCLIRAMVVGIRTQTQFMHRFQSRLLLSFMILIIVPMIFMAYFGRNLILAQQEKTMQSDLEEDLAMARSLLEGETLVAATELAAHPELIRAIREKHAEAPAFFRFRESAIRVFDGEGAILWAEDTQTPGSEILNRVRSTLLPYLVYGDPDHPSVGAIVPVFDDQDNTLCRGFIEYIRPIDENLCGSLSQTIDRDIHFFTDGTISASNHPELFDAGFLCSKLPGDAFLNIELLGMKSFFVKNTTGSDSYVEGYQPMYDGLGRIAGVLSIPRPYLRYGLEQQTARALSVVLVVYGLILSMTLIISVILSRRISAPVRELTEGTQRIAAGELDVSIESQARDELGDLVASFNKMTRDLKLSQERLVQAEKDAAWREMARQVAHEVKNPLTPMKLSIQHLRQAFTDRADNFEEILAETTQMVSEQIDVLKNIASEFSSFARLPRRELQACQINEILRNSLRLFAESLQNIRLITDYHEPMPLIDLDPKEMQRVFVNIVQNALQAMPDGGNLAIRTELERQETGGGNVDNIIVRISDTGCGIPEEEQARLFQPSFSTKTEGAGLGLAISRKVIDELGGNIRIRSEVGVGTDVTIVLPVGKAGPESP